MVSVSRIVLTFLCLEVVALFFLVLRVKQYVIEEERMPRPIQIVPYFHNRPIIIERTNDSTVSSSVGTEDGEHHHLYADEDLHIEAVEESKACIETFLSKYSDYCERALVPGPQLQNSYLLLSNNRRITSICPCISPYLRKYIDV